jgi:hypothetical protein
LMLLPPQLKPRLRRGRGANEDDSDKRMRQERALD